ncbi:hypothetical protein C446_13344 [Halobiforma nitratireducens JCM 10879]|uniref:Uncharacterized protein n=1 Tax=Halobiforma nitratireducens JCM 10879 TaxID=1227454 RepID=M0LPU8_9EURY|nr:hypothetical protein C446_13344 [Halobiforma nitratireducens JCM 10879]
MTTQTPSGHEYTLDHTWYGDACRLDSEGHLHTGSATSHVSSLTVTYTTDRGHE